MYKAIILVQLCLIVSVPALTQGYTDFGDMFKITVDGIEFGYNIMEEKPAKLDDSDCVSITIQWYMSNKDRFSKIYSIQHEDAVRDAAFDTRRTICMARLHVRNALDSRSSLILRQPNVVTKFLRKGFVIALNARKTGYLFQPGEILYGSTTVKLQKDKKPDIAIQPAASPAL